MLCISYNNDSGFQSGKKITNKALNMWEMVKEEIN